MSSADRLTAGYMEWIGRRLLEQKIEFIAPGNDVVNPKRPIRLDLHGIVASRMLTAHSDPDQSLVPERWLVPELVQAVAPVLLLRKPSGTTTRPITGRPLPPIVTLAVWPGLTSTSVVLAELYE